MELHEQRDVTQPPRQQVSTRGTCVAREALAHVAIHLVEAGAVVLAGPGRALVDVDVAVVSLEAGHTEAAVAVHPVAADGSVLARAGGALIDVGSAVGPGEARLADAGIVPRTLDTRPIV